MLKTAVSIKVGKLMPSTVLRKLGSYNRQNRLHRAFRELGRVVRTEFLLNWISDLELRRVTTGSLNKSEDFNRFTQWVAFGGRLLAENDRDEQRKLIKYNHNKPSVSRFDALQDVKPAHRRLIMIPRSAPLRIGAWRPCSSTTRTAGCAWKAF
jgi:hypothetical protein